MVNYVTASGLRGGVSGEFVNVCVDGGQSGAGESLRTKRGIGHVARAALTAALLSSTALVASSVAANAQPLVWNGSFNNDWNMLLNWTPSITPGAIDEVLIGGSAGPNHNPMIWGPSTVGKVTIQGGAHGNTTVTILNQLTATDVKLQTDGAGNDAGLRLQSGGKGFFSTLDMISGASSEIVIWFAELTVSGQTNLSAGSLKISQAGQTSSSVLNAEGGLTVSGTSVFNLGGSGGKLTVGKAASGNLTIEGAGSSFIVDTGFAADASMGVHVAGDLIAKDNGTFKVTSGYMGVVGSATITDRKLEIGVSSLYTSQVKIDGALSIAGSNGAVVLGSASSLDADGKLTVAGMTTVGAVGAVASDAKLTVQRKGNLEAQGGLTVNDRASFEIAGGSVKVGSAGDGKVSILGSSNLKLVAAGGADGTITAGEIALVDAGSSITFNNSGTAINDFIISGKGGLDIQSGTVFLKAGSTYEGATQLTGGIVGIDNVSALGAGTSGNRAVVFAGGTLQIGTQLATDAGIVFSQNKADNKFIVTSGGGFTINQALSGDNVIVGGNSNSGTLVLAGENSYTGSTNISQFGVVQVSDIKNLGAGDGKDRRVNFTGNSAQLKIAGTNFSDGVTGNLVLEVNNNIAAILNVYDANNTVTLTKAVSGSGTSSLEKKGAGTLVLSTATNASTVATWAVSEGTLTVSDKANFGSASKIILKGGNLKAVESTNTVGKAIELARGSGASDVVTSSIEVAKDKTLTVSGAILFSNPGASGKATLVKKGEGELVLGSMIGNAQTGNVLEAGTLRVTRLGQLGTGSAEVEFKGGALAIGDGTGPASLTNDSNITYKWTGTGQNSSAAFDIAGKSEFTIGNSLGLSYTGGGTGNLIKLGEGTLTLSTANIFYNGATGIAAGILRTELGDDKTKFRFKNGIYAVQGGTLEADISDLTITQLVGSGKVVESYPGIYSLVAGTIQIAHDDIFVFNQRAKTLTVNATSGETGFWGKIVGLLNNGLSLAGKLVIDAPNNGQVLLTGNTSQVGAVEVKVGKLRVNNGTLPTSDQLGAPTVDFHGVVKANTISVNGTKQDRAYLAGSGTVEAPSISIGMYGSLLGNQAGTLTLKGNVTTSIGSTIELGSFKTHYNSKNNPSPANPYFFVDGKFNADISGVTINLNNDALDPGVYRILASTNSIANSDFKLGSPGADLPLSSLSLVKTSDNLNLDMHATTARAELRFWNATPVADTTTWSVGGSSWTNADKSNAGPLHLTNDASVVGVFGYTGFPQQQGTVQIQSTQSQDNYVTQGLQFISGDWQLTGDRIDLKGGAAATQYKDWSTFNVSSGNVVVESQLVGVAGLRVTGGGNLSLSGKNYYAGGTQLLGGTLSVASNTSLGQTDSTITLKGGTLSLASTFGSTSHPIVVANNGGDTTSTIRLGGGKVEFNGALTGNGTLVLENGHAAFAGKNVVNFNSGTVNVSAGAALSVNGEGYIRSANVSGVLHGSFGHTLGIKSLELASTAEVKLVLPAASNGAVTAFQGSSAALNGQISALDLPEEYSVGLNGKSLFVFDYADRSGQIVVSEAVKAQYANSDFTFGGVVNGYLVLNSKSGPGPNPQNSETADFNILKTSENWTPNTFVDGQTWNNGTATFLGNGTNRPVNVEGNVRVAGLVINGPNFVFQNAGVAGQPGAFLMQPASGGSSIDLTVNQGASATIAIPMGGADFAKKGDGLLTISGSSGDYQGTGTVQGGALHVTGNFSGAGFDVANGLLRVNGQAKSVIVAANGALEGLFTGPDNSRGVNIGTLIVNGGALKPGNSPGTLRLGSLAQTAGSIEFERGDMIQVLRGVGGTPDGQAVFAKAADGSRVQLKLVNSQGYTFGNTYAFVTAENGVTFTSADAVQVSEVGNSRLFSAFQAEAVGTNGNFYLQRNRAFAAEAWSPNQAAVARAIDASSINGRRSVGPIYDAIASASSTQAFAVRAAFDQLSGEIHPSVSGVLIDESRHLRDATANRTRAALNETEVAPGQNVVAPKGANLSLWGQAYGSWGETSRTYNTAKLDRSTGGFILGFDSGIADNWRLGVAGGYAKSNVKSNSELNRADVDNYNLAIYGGGQWGALGLRMGAGYTWHRLDTTRQFNAFGLRDTANAKYDAGTFQVYGETGYALNFDAAKVEPFVSLAYVHHESDGFLERDMGLSTALRGRSQSDGTTFSTAGLRLSRAFDLGGVKGVARGTVGWRHAFGDVDPQAVFFSTSSPALFSVTGAPIAKNAVVLGAGLDVEIAAGTTLGVSYTGQVGNNTSDHGLRGNFSIKF